MNFNIDLHSHTIASTHAYSTIGEYVTAAKAKGIVMFANTDHGPAVPDGAHRWHFGNLKVVPHIFDDVAVLRGIEANILESGEIDMDVPILKQLDIVLAGLHPNLTQTNSDTHTKLLIKVIESGLVDVISHPGDVRYQYDELAFLECAKANNVAIEINSSSDVNSRFKSKERCIRIGQMAAKIGNAISIGSDAHICHYLGNFENAIDTLEKSGIKEEQIINTNPKSVLDFLSSRGHSNLQDIRKHFGL